MAATTAAVVAAVAATAVAASAASSSEKCDCCGPLTGRRRKGQKQEAGVRLPLIGPDAPEVKCRLDPSKPVTGPCRIAIVKDMLVIGRKPGEADDSVLLTGAKIVLKGTTVLVSPRLTPPLTLHFSTVPEAERWASKLRNVAGMHERVPSQGLEDSQRAQSARIAELEARVSATLHAAVDRSKRIKELEATIEEGKERDARIKQLEEAVEETMQEASARGERIKELEAVLASRGGVPDAAASAVLEDAMQFAEQMLENRQEELAIDGEGAQGLQEAVEAVQRAKPAVDGDVADLVSKLVTALRWPLVLRRRLVDAEQTVKHQKEIQDHTLRELQNLQQRHETSESEKAQVEAEVISLKRQLTMAERTAEEAVGRLEEIHNSTGGEHLTLQDQRPMEEAKRTQAEALSRELRDKLALAEKAVEESTARQKEELDALHQDEVQALQRKHDDTEVARKAAQEHAEELRDMLVVAERNANKAVAEQREELERAHADDLAALQRLREEADVQRRDAEERSNDLRRQLELTEQAIDAAASQEKRLLDEQHEEELLRLRQEQQQAKDQRDDAAQKALELEARLQAAEQAAKLAADQVSLQTVDADKRREFAELQAIALKQRLVDAEQAFDESMKSQKALKDSAHDQELQDLHERHALARKERDLAETRAAQLSDELLAAQRAADTQVAEKYEALDAVREDEVTAVRKQHAKAEAMIGEVEMRANELREKLASAESALNNKTERQRDFLNQSAQKHTEPQQVRPDRPKSSDSLNSMDVLDEIKREKARITELESRLAASMQRPPSKHGTPPHPDLNEAMSGLDGWISSSDRRANAAAPAPAPAHAPAAAPAPAHSSATADAPGRPRMATLHPSGSAPGPRHVQHGTERQVPRPASTKSRMGPTGQHYAYGPGYHGGR